jgi:hypothetical protein
MNCQRVGCNKTFDPSNPKQKYCSSYCRKRKSDEKGNQGWLTEVLQKHGVSLDEIGKIDKVKVSEWESQRKGGGTEVLNATSLVLSPKWESGPEWPVVAPAKPTVIKSVVPTRRPRTKWKTCVVLPDPQIGYRLLRTGTLDPFHSEGALSVALKVIQRLQPDLIVNLGDLLDLPAHGTFTQEPAFQQTTQASIDRAHKFLAEQKANSPKSKMILMEGNHDSRLPKNILTNAAASFGLQRANLPDSWPILSVPDLLRLDELGVEYVSGYPNSHYWINDRLVCKHGPTKLRSAGSSAAASIDDERVSVVTGHIHRIELQHKTRNKRDGFTQNFVASVGCLSRIDGAVPSTKGSVDLFGAPTTNYEDWQQGLGVIRYQEGEGNFHLDITPIFDGSAVLWGEVI